jgi:hypothetical protein
MAVILLVWTMFRLYRALAKMSGSHLLLLSKHVLLTLLLPHLLEVVCEDLFVSLRG